MVLGVAKAESPQDVRIVAGSESVVPVSVEVGEVVVDVMIDGRGPFPMMFDTGADDAITPETAAVLKLNTESSGTLRDSAGAAVPITFTHVVSLRLGNAEMTDQRFAVVPLPRYLTNRGSRPALAGLIGYNLLSRFAVRLDYDKKTLTVSSGRDFQYKGKGERVPLTVKDRAPVVPAAADGIPGTFVVDTGSIGALTLQREFVEDHGLEGRHPSALRIKAIGAAGPFEAIMTRLDSFDIAGDRIERPATRYPSIRGQGLPLKDVDGSMGYEILRQFVTTFDYRRGDLWFERSDAYGARTGQAGAGFQAAKIEGAGFGVTTVLPNTAAATAGLRVGDLITEVDSLSTLSMDQNELALLMRRPVGTLVHLAILRDGIATSVELTLRDVLP